MKRPAGYWYVAAIYACGYGSVSFVLPHINQYLLGAGFSGVQIGNLNSLAGIIGLGLGPALLLVADRTGRHRLALLIMLLVETVALLTVGLGVALIVLAVGIIVYRVALTQDVTLRNRLTLHWLHEQDSEAFGGLRLWGSLGYSILAAVGGQIAARTGASVLFVLASGLVLLMVPLRRVFSARLSIETDGASAEATDRPGPATPGKSMGPEGAVGGFAQRILKPFKGISPTMVVVLSVAFLFALSQALFFGWNFDFVENTLGGGKRLVGYFSAWSALVEVPVMKVADRFIVWIGTVKSWLVGLLFWLAGCALLSVVQTPVQALLVVTLIGVSSGFVLVVPVVMVGQVSQLNRTGLNLALMGTFSSLGFIFGNPVAGWLFDTLGVRLVLRGSAGLSLLAAVVLVAGWSVVSHRAAHPGPDNCTPGS